MTVAVEGAEARWVDVEAQLTAGEFAFIVLRLGEKGRVLLTRSAEAGGLTALGWVRTQRRARTIADLEGADVVRRAHVAEALVYRRVAPGSAVGDPLMAGWRLARQVLKTPTPTA